MRWVPRGAIPCQQMRILRIQIIPAIARLLVTLIINEVSHKIDCWSMHKMKIDCDASLVRFTLVGLKQR